MTALNNANTIVAQTSAGKSVKTKTIDAGKAVLKAKAGEHYSVVDQNKGQHLANLIATKVGNHLILDYANGVQVTIEDYFSVCENDACTVTVAGEDAAGYQIAAEAEGVAVDGASLIYAHGDRGTLMAMVKGNAAMSNAFVAEFGDLSVASEAGLSEQGAFWAKAAGRLVFLGAGGMAIHQAIDSDSDGSGEPTIIQGNISAGPVIAGNGLTVTAYAADGRVLGVSSVEPGSSSYTITITEDYIGPILIKVTDADDGNDYVDEATNTRKDLNADLRAVTSINGTDTVTINVNDLTELAVRELGLAGGDSGSSEHTLSNITTEQINTANQNVATATGLTGVDLIDDTVELIIDETGAANPDVNDYGQVLAAISGMEYGAGISKAAALDQLAAALTGNALTDAAKTDLVAATEAAGADTASVGENLEVANPIALAEALAAVHAAAAGNTAELGLDDLTALGMQGVTADNLPVIQAAIAASADDATAVDTIDELQALLTPAVAGFDAAKAVIAAYADDNTQPAPTVQDYINVGITGVDADNFNAVNAGVAAVASADVDTVAKIQAIVDADFAGSITAITGTATQGQTLEAGTITDADGGVTGISYQWQADGSDIDGATAATYTLTQAEVGKIITVVATYTDNEGSGKTAASAATAAVANINDPASISAITGTVTQGQTLTAGTITDADGTSGGSAVAPTYVWKADGVVITGATSNSYTLTQAEVGKVITVEASYTDAQGTSETITSAPTATVGNINDRASISAITGTATQGETLTAGTIIDADGTTDITPTYVWKADSVVITGATSNSYTLTQAEVGKVITVEASYIDALGTSETVTSAATAAVANVDDAGSISAIEGTVTQGQTLEAGTITDADGGVTGITYQWQADGSDIDGATGATYTLTQAEVGKTITVVATYTDNEGSGKTATSAATAAVANVDDSGSISAITGRATQGETLEAGTITDADGGVTGITYQWRADGSDIDGATADAYTLTQAEVGKIITVVATYTDNEGSGKTATSAATAAVANVDDAGSISAIEGRVTQGQTLTAGTITDADGGVTGISYQWQADGSDIDGATADAYTLTQAEVGKTITVVATYTDNEGSGNTATSAATAAVANINDPASISAITGTLTQGGTLTAGAITDADGTTDITPTYVWRADDVVITGATSNTYTLTQAEVGKAITVEVSYTDAQGTSETITSAPTAVVTNVNEAGSISAITGTLTQGETLTAGTITDADGTTGITPTYVWKADGVVITGATSNSYTLTQAEVGKVITVEASYIDALGTSETVTSAATAAVANVDDAGSISAITGRATQGQTLTAGTITDADGGVTGISYQWQADGSDIDGATAATYTLTQAEVGKIIRVVATYTDNEGSGKTAASAATAAVANVDDAGSISAIEGTVTQGQTLMAGTITDADGGVTGITYQWRADGSDIDGATAATYTLTQAEVGKIITVVATYTDNEGSGKTATSVATTAVGNINDPGSITITGTLAQGGTLTAGITDADGTTGGLSVPPSYEWRADGVAIAGATNSNTYTLTQAEVGKVITVEVSYTDAQGTSETITSAPTEAVANINDPGSITITGTLAQGGTLTAGITDADGTTGGLSVPPSYEWRADGVAIAGATNSNTYTLTQAEVGKAITVEVSYTDAQGTSETITSAPTAAVTNINDPGSITITGTLAQGGTLTAGTISDADGTTGGLSVPPSYEWRADGVAIAGATNSNTYTLTQAEVGKAITVEASYTDALGTSETITSAPTAAVANINDPGSITITGTLAQGGTLTAGITDADGTSGGSAVAPTYVWKADDVVILGATASTYTLTQAEVGKVITVEVSYTDAQGTSETITSAPTAAVANVDDAGSISAITGRATQGGTLMAGTITDADGGVTGISYQWRADGSDIDGATAATYTLTQAEVGKTITVVATYTDNEGSGKTAASTPTAAVGNSNDRGSISAITGTVTQGGTLTAGTITDADGTSGGSAVAPTYVWKADDVVILGATASTYTLTQAEVGKVITVEVSYTDAQGTSETITSAPTAVVTNVNEAGSISAITGTLTQGETLTAGTITDADGTSGGSAVAPSYVWKADGVVITGATSNSYTLTQAEVGKAITVEASYTDALGTSETVTSAATTAVANIDDAGSISAITGMATQGQTLMAGTITDADGGVTGISYQWQADGSDIDGATGDAYTLTQAEVDKIITVVATYTDNEGSDKTAASAPTTAVANVDDAGSISAIEGMATQGETLEAGTITDADGGVTGISYQWQADGSDIDGATAATYTLSQAEVGKIIRVVATYTDNEGSDKTAASAPTTAVANVDDAGSISAIEGRVTQGQTLTAGSITDADGGVTGISYQWRADGSDIDGATAATYTLSQAEVGKIITVVATYTDNEGSDKTAASAATAAVVNINDPASISAITGTVTQGGTLTAGTITDADGTSGGSAVAPTYVWRANGVVILGATASTYTLTQAEVGKVITVEVSYTDAQGTSETITSAPTAVVTNVNEAGSISAITGTLTQGETLTAGTITDADGSTGITPTYVWKADGVAIRGATSNSYTLTQAEVGKAITVEATYTDALGTSETVTSAATAAVANVDDAGSISAIIGTAAQGETLTAGTITDADGSTDISPTYVWRADGVAIIGATASTYTLTQAEVGKVISVEVSYTDALGTPETVISAPTAAVTDVNEAGSISAITGTAAQGETLTAGTITDADGSTDISPTYVWKADGVTIRGATASTYTLTEAEVGKVISVEASYIDAQGTPETVTSTPTAAVANINDPASISAIIGTAAQGQTLTAGTITDADGSTDISPTYVWKADDVAIRGATSNSYTLTQAEVGKVITVEVSYTDAQGTPETVTSAATTAVIDVNEAGSISAIEGRVVQGETLTAGTISDADGSTDISPTYVWKADGVVITGATNSNTYTLTQAEVGKVISVEASYTDAQGTPETVTSAATTAVANVDDAGSISAIEGTVTQGETLTAGTITDADGGVTGISYQWRADGSDIGGATAATYTLTQAEVGKIIRVVATYTDNEGSGKTATSAATTAVGNINDPTSISAITGTAAQGQTLTAGTITDADGTSGGSAVDPTYVWRADNVVIIGATSNSYTLTQAEVGKAITVEASYTDAQGTSETVTSAATAAVVNVDDAGSISAITGMATEGETLTAGTITDADGGVTGIAYQWRADGSDIGGATAATYTLSQAEVGKIITVVATYTDNEGSGKTATSAATTAVVNVDDAGSISAITGRATQGQTLTAGIITDADGTSGGSAVDPTYVWKADDVAITGATSNSYTLTQAEVGKVISVEVSYTDAYGTPETITSAATEVVANINDPGSISAITGTVTQGGTLTVGTITDADGTTGGSAVDPTYVWKADGVAIAGATASTYTLTEAEVGKVITVEATYTDAQGTTETVTSAATAVVTEVNEAGSISAITGTAAQGETLTAGTITDADGTSGGSAVAPRYVWKADGVAIGGATGNSYTLTQAEVGKAISVEVSYTDALGTTETVTSAATAAVANINDRGSISAITGTLAQGGTLTAGTITDADGTSGGSAVAPIYVWKADGVAIGGATSNSYTLTQAEVGKVIIVEAIYTDAQGTTEKVTSAPTAAVTNVTVTITSDVAALKTGETATITFTFNEAPIGFERADVAVTGGTLSDPTVAGSDDKVYTATFTPAVDSTARPSITIAAGAYANAAGKPGAAGTSPIIAVDTAAPRLVIELSDTSLSVGETATVTFSFSEAVLGFTAADITAPNGTITHFEAVDGEPTIYTATFTPTAVIENLSNEISVGTGYTDIVGNTGTVGTSDNYAVDTLATLSLLAVNGRAASGETSEIAASTNVSIKGQTTGVEAGQEVRLAFTNLGGAVAEYEAGDTLKQAGFTDESSGSAAVDFVSQVVDGSTQQVIRLNDDTDRGAAAIEAALGDAAINNIFTVGAKVSANIKLDSANGAEGLFIALQIDTADLPAGSGFTGNYRYGFFVRKSAANTLRITGADDDAIEVDVANTVFDEFNRIEFVVGAGFADAAILVNGIEVVDNLSFAAVEFVPSSRLSIGSGSFTETNRVSYLSDISVIAANPADVVATVEADGSFTATGIDTSFLSLDGSLEVTASTADTAGNAASFDLSLDIVAAIAIIAAYADGDGITPPALTLQNYLDAGITDVTASNLDAVNARVLASATGGADSVAEVQALVAAHNDQVAPRLAIELSDTSLSASETATVTFSFSEAVLGFTAADITAPNGAITHFAVDPNDATIYTATFTPTADIEDLSNEISVGTGYTDIVGNTGTVGTSDNYAVDTLATLSLLAVNGRAASGEASEIAAAANVAIKGQTTSVEVGQEVRLSFTNPDGVLANYESGNTLANAGFTPSSSGSATVALVQQNVNGNIQEVIRIHDDTDTGSARINTEFDAADINTMFALGLSVSADIKLDTANGERGLFIGLYVDDDNLPAGSDLTGNHRYAFVVRKSPTGDTLRISSVDDTNILIDVANTNFDDFNRIEFVVGAGFTAAAILVNGVEVANDLSFAAHDAGGTLLSFSSASTGGVDRVSYLSDISVVANNPEDVVTIVAIDGSFTATGIDTSFLAAGASLDVTASTTDAGGNAANFDLSLDIVPAIALIAAYANGDGITPPALTLKNYLDAGITDVTAGNVDAVNARVLASAIGEADTVAEVQALVAAQNDQIAPTLAIEMSSTRLNAADTATVTFSFSEAVLGFTAADITAPNGTITNFAVDQNDATIYTATFTPSADIEDLSNEISVGTGYTDVVGNTGTAGTSHNYAIDTLATLALSEVNGRTASGATSEIAASANVAIKGQATGIEAGREVRLVFTNPAGVVAEYEPGKTLEQAGFIDDSADRATVDLVAQNVDGSTQQVIRLNDDTRNGIARINAEFTEAEVSNIFTVGARVSANIKLDSANGADGIYIALQVGAGDLPQGSGFSGNQRYIMLVSKSATANTLKITSAGGNAIEVDVDYTNFDDFNRIELVVGAGFADAAILVNGIEVANKLSFAAGGSGSGLVFSSGSTAGVDRVSYLSDISVIAGNPADVVAIVATDGSFTATGIDTSLLVDGDSLEVAASTADTVGNAASFDLSLNIVPAIAIIAAYADGDGIAPPALTLQNYRDAGISDVTAGNLDAVNARVLASATGEADTVAEVQAIVAAHNDQVAPTVTITLSDTSLSVGETATVTFSFSETVLGFTAADISADNGVISGLTVDENDATIYTAMFTPTADIEDLSNKISVGTGYTDVIGNTGTAGSSANYAVDTLATLSLLAVNGRAASGATSDIAAAANVAIKGQATGVEAGQEVRLTLTNPDRLLTEYESGDELVNLGWDAFVSDSATIEERVEQNVGGNIQQVIRLNDDTALGNALISAALDATAIANIFAVGARVSANIKLDSTDGANGLFISLQIDAADLPEGSGFTGNHRYGFYVSKSATANTLKITAADGNTIELDVDNTVFDEFNRIELVVGAGFADAAILVNGIEVANNLRFAAGGFGSALAFSSESSSESAAGDDSVSYLAHISLTANNPEDVVAIVAADGSFTATGIDTSLLSLGGSLEVTASTADTAGNTASFDLSLNIVAAIAIIAAYADGDGITPPALTLQNYLDAGITDVTASNLDAVNARVLASATGVAGTVEAVQALVNTAATVIAIIEAYADDATTNPEPSLENYANIGVAGVSANNLAAVNAVVAAAPGNSADVNTLAKIQALVSTIVIKAYADDNSQPAPRVDDYAAIGVIGVSAANLEALNAVVTAAGSAAVDTLAKVQALVPQAVIEAYADDSNKPAPRVEDYAAIGVIGVSAGNLAAVNAAVAAAPDGSEAVDTLAEIQALVDAGVTLTLLQVNGRATSGETSDIAASANVAISGQTTGVAEGQAVRLAFTTTDWVLVEYEPGDTLAEAGFTTSTTGGTEVGITSEVVDGANQDVIAISDVLNNGIARLNAALSDTDINTIFTVGATVSANIKLHSDVGAEGLFIGLQVGAGDLPAGSGFSGNHRYGFTVSKSANANTLKITGADGNAIAVDVDNTVFDDFNRIELVVGAGFADAAILVNGIEVANNLRFAAAGSGSSLVFSSGSTPGINRVSYLADISLIPGNPADVVATVEADGSFTATGIDTSFLNDGDSLAVRASTTDAAGTTTHFDLNLNIVPAIAIIAAYADGDGITPPALTLQNYHEAGLTGVTATNVDAVNARVLATATGAAGTVAELQAVVAQVVIEAYANDNSQPAPSLEDYAAIGVSDVSATNLAAVNAAIDAAANGSADVDTPAKIQALVAVIVAATTAIEAYADDSSNTAPSVDDYANIGVSGVSANNLAAVNAAVAAAPANSADVDTLAKVQALVSPIVIKAYADDATKPAPSVDDYAAIAVIGVSAANLVEVNAAVAAVGSAAVNTLAKVQALVSQEVIKAYADDNSQPAPSVDDYAAIGVSAVTAGNLAAVNAAVAATTNSAAVDTLAEVQALVYTVVTLSLSAVNDRAALGDTSDIAASANVSIKGQTTGLEQGHEVRLAFTTTDWVLVEYEPGDTLAEAGFTASSNGGTGVSIISEVVDGIRQDVIRINDDSRNGLARIDAALDTAIINTIFTVGATVSANIKLDSDDPEGLFIGLRIGAADLPAGSSFTGNHRYGFYVSKSANANTLKITDADANTIAIDVDNTVFDDFNRIELVVGAGFADAAILVNGIEVANNLRFAAAGSGSALSFSSGSTAGFDRVSYLADISLVAGNPTDVVATVEADGSFTATGIDTSFLNAGDSLEVRASTTDAAGTTTHFDLNLNIVTAIAIIAAYADGDGITPPALTLQNYHEAGITGVTATNLDAVNTRVLASATGAAGTVAEVQALASQLVIEVYANDNSQPAPSLEDYANIGVTDVSAANLAAVNAAVATAANGSADVDTLAEVQNLVHAELASSAVIEAYADDASTNPAPSLDDYANIGLSGVTANNLAALNAAVAAAPGNSAAVDTLAKVQALLSPIVIKAYADDNSQPAPSVDDYAVIAVIGVSAANLAAVNAAVAALSSAAVDTLAKVQALVSQEIIKAYADNSNQPAPSVEDYAAIAVIGVSADNLAAVNAAVAVAIGGSADVDTLAKVQALVSQEVIEAYADNSNKPAPSVEDYAAIAVSGVTANNLDAVNAAVAASPNGSADVDTLAKIQALATAAAASSLLIENYAYDSSNIAPSVYNYANIGVTGVTTDNLDAVNAVIAASPNGSADVNTVAKVQALVAAVVLSSAIIEAYADDATKPAPSLDDYANIGVTGVTTDKLDAVNAAVATVPGNSAAVDTVAKVQALVDATVLASAIIAAYADDNTKPVPAIEDYADIGVTGVTAANLAAVNAAVAATNGSADVDTVAKIQALVSPIVIAAYADATTNPAPSLADYAAIGVTAVTANNLAAVNAVVAAAPGNSADVDTVAEVQALVDAAVLSSAIIEAYADDHSQPAPSLADYANIGVTAVSAANLDAVNAAVHAAANGSADVNTFAEVQALATAAAAATAVIEAYADDNSQPAPGLEHYAAIGVSGVSAYNLAMVNAAVAVVPSTAVDTVLEVQALVSGIVIETYANNNSQPVPSLDDYAAIGVTGVTTGNLAAVNAVLDAAVGDSAAVDTLAEVQALVDTVLTLTLLAVNGRAASGETDIAASANVSISGQTTAVAAGHEVRLVLTKPDDLVAEYKAGNTLAQAGFTAATTGSATVDRVDQNVDGNTQQVIRLNDDTIGIAQIDTEFDTAAINNIFAVGARVSATIKLDSTDGANGLFIALQIDAGDLPEASGFTGNHRYGFFVSKSATANTSRISVASATRFDYVVK